MGLSSLFALTAVLAGLVGLAIAGIRPTRDSMIGRLIVGCVAAAAICIGVIIVLALTGSLEPAGVSHIAYLGGVISVPIVAVGLLIRHRTSVFRGPSWRRPALILAAILPALLGVYMTHIEPRWLDVDRHTVDVPGIQRNVRVGVLADLQTGHIGDHERRAVDALLEANPDIIVIPGDFWEMSSTEFQGRFSEFAALLQTMVDATDAVVIVEGDHDWQWGVDQLAAATGAISLDDATARIDVAGQSVLVAGFAVRGARAERARVVEELREAPAAELTLVVAHRPGIVYEVGPDAAAALLTGHTHGGQVQIPFIGPIVTFSAVPHDVAGGGMHRIEENNLYVSPGVGLLRGQAPQMRFGARPSVGVIDFRATGN